ncbi:plakophilin-1 isoform X2 [Neoarius graeffei]|uniref:plakophilin-1 isoform X2 n=1 Tax=Neoarius graeffei TaxID=443677 RepID=UPI00298C4ACB|nr:plakophilin-1 isoform X2 [Neoarius graeffei]
MRRSKSKYNSRGSSGTLSPTSPKSDSVLHEYKFSPTHLNGSDFVFESTLGNGQAKTRSQKQSIMQRSLSTKSANYHRMPNNMFQNTFASRTMPSATADLYASQMGVKVNTSQWNQQYKQSKVLERRDSQPVSTSPVQMKGNAISQSTSNHLISRTTINRRPPSAHSNSDLKLPMASKIKDEMNGMNAEAKQFDIPLSEAISCINSGDERYQLHGASVILHNTYTDDKAKEEVRKLNGITPLVSLLHHSNPQVQLMSVSALRNLVFKNSANKEEVRRIGGLTEALHLLRDTNMAETQKHVTGLLWNLSSEESIQPDLLRQALPVLTETVLQPYADHSTIVSDLECRTETFYNVTGCLRNLSSGKLPNRQALRNCEGLIDSLVTHMQSSVESNNLDNKSVENCVCVLHNLTYQLETESPAMFSKINALELASETRASSADTGPIGCFSNQSRKIQQESNCQYPLMDDLAPKGKSRLVHSKTLESYLHLLSYSQNEITQGACAGVLHNLTAKKGIVSDTLSHIIVQRLNGIHSISPHLESQNLTLRNSISTLIGNLSRTPQLHRALARQALPGVIKTLTSDYTPESDSAIAAACHTTNNLLRGEPELGKKFLSNGLINSLNNMSNNLALPKASKAAGVLLHNLWSDKTIQGFLKKFR